MVLWQKVASALPPRLKPNELHEKMRLPISREDSAFIQYQSHL